MAGGEQAPSVATTRVLLPCAFAITVSTALVAAVALFNVDEVSSSALALDAFRSARPRCSSPPGSYG